LNFGVGMGNEETFKPPGRSAKRIKPTKECQRPGSEALGELGKNREEPAQSPTF